MVYNNFMKDGSYGVEVIIDLHGCDTTRFTHEGLTTFLTQLIAKADMNAYGPPNIWEDFDATEPHLKGISAFQWIHTSNIVIHALSMIKLVMINLFTCKPFDHDEIAAFAKTYFGAQKSNHRVISRAIEGDAK